MQTKWPNEFATFGECTVNAPNIGSFAACKLDFNEAISKTLSAAFSNEGFSLNGKLLPAEPKRADVEAILGKATRVESGEDHNSLIFDPFGIEFFIKGDSLSLVRLCMQKCPHPGAPTGTYGGAITVAGEKFSPKTTAADLKQATAEPRFEEMSAMGYRKKLSGRTGYLGIHDGALDRVEIGLVAKRE